MKRHSFVDWKELDTKELYFALGVDRHNKASVNLTSGPQCHDVAITSPPAVTFWPRVTGDGNYGTMWGPSDPNKAKFSLDLSDAPINGEVNVDFQSFADKLSAIDDKLLDFVCANQLKLLGRKNLSREEVKVLQIRTVRPKYDKMSGNLTGHNINMTTTKWAWDGMGGKYARKINVCDCNGTVVPNGIVCPGDVVSATMYANMVYTGVGGDKFGIHWSFEDVAVICQRAKLEHKDTVPAFASLNCSFSHPYTDFSEQQLVTVGDGGSF